MTRPRIAFFTAEYDDVRTGPGTFMDYLRRETARGRMDLVFFSSEMAVAKADYERRVELPVRLPSPPGMFLQPWMWHEAMLAEHRRTPFDAVWCNSSMAAYVGSMRARIAPVVAMVNDYSNAMTTDLRATMQVAGAYRTLTRFFWMWFERATVRRCEMVIVNSRYLRDEIIRRYRLDPSRVEILYKGVDLDMFRPAPDRRALDPAKVRVVFLKNDYVRGGYHDLVAALARVPFETELTVAGPLEPEFGSIRAIARAAGYRGELKTPGRTPRSEVPALLRDADVVCVPSRVEALGVTFMEAIASGVPTIGSTAGGIPEVLDDGRAGWMVPPFSPDAVAAALRDVVERPDERARRTAHGLRHVQTFSVAQSLARFEELAAKVVARGIRPANR